MWLVIPSLDYRWSGRSSRLRFDPKVSVDYNCIFVEGHSLPSFAVPWLSRSTPIDYLRIRYAPQDDGQPYGVMFVDPKTLAYSVHSGCVERPAQLSGRLDSPSLVRDWMRSQAKSAKAASHDGDAQEIYSAIVALSQLDLEHFTVPQRAELANFQIVHASRVSHLPPFWPSTLFALIPFWIGAFQRKGSARQFTLPKR
jgi:hypothetical protein